MKVIKKTKEYTVYQKGSGRYAVKNAHKNWVNADEKIAILLAEGLIKAVAPAPACRRSASRRRSGSCCRSSKKQLLLLKKHQ